MIETYVPKNKMVTVSKTVTSGAAVLDLTDLGLSSSNTLVSAIASVNYASGQTPTLLATVQVQTNGLNIYVRDVVAGANPTDGSYSFTILVNYR